MLRRCSAVVAILVALAGCGQRPPPALYILSPTLAPEAPAGGAGMADPVVAVLRVRIPHYLDRPEIVSRTGANALVIDEDARWAEPLDESVPRVLAESLSRRLPGMRVLVPQEARGRTVRYEYLVGLDAFESDGAGNAVLRGRWHLRDLYRGRVVSEGRLDERRPGASPDAAEVVAALNQTLDAASRDMAEAMAAILGR